MTFDTISGYFVTDLGENADIGGGNNPDDLSYETPFYTGYIPGIYLSHEIVRSARLQNFDCDAAVYTYWIARVFNVLQNVAAVPLGIRQPA